MCLAIPMKVIEKENDYGIVELNGVKYRAGFQLIDNVDIGDYVVVHAGFAIQKLDEKEAKEILNILTET